MIQDPAELREGNKALAQFMGYKYYPYHWPMIDPANNSGSRGEKFVPGWKSHPHASNFRKFNVLAGHKYLARNHNDLPYFSDWNALMEVVEKVEGMGFHTDIVGVTCRISRIGQLPGEPFFSIGKISDTKKKAVWFAMVEFTKKISEKE